LGYFKSWCNPFFKRCKELRRKAIRVIVYKETSRINALKEQEGGRGYGSGFEGLVNYIMDQLPSNEVIENALRKKGKSISRKSYS